MYHRTTRRLIFTPFMLNTKPRSTSPPRRSGRGLFRVEHELWRLNGPKHIETNYSRIGNWLGRASRSTSFLH
jgi:hypothetical protein